MYMLCFKAGFHYPSWRPELTARVDGWPVSITRQHSTRQPVNPLTRAINSGSGNRALTIHRLLLVISLSFHIDSDSFFIEHSKVTVTSHSWRLPDRPFWSSLKQAAGPDMTSKLTTRLPPLADLCRRTRSFVMSLVMKMIKLITVIK